MSSEREQELWRTNTDAAYAEAERRIKKVIVDRSPELHLFDLYALVRLPPEIAQCVSLSRLQCDDTGIAGDDLAYLTPLTGLRELTLAGTQISDAGLAHLNSLIGLQLLNLENTQIGDAGMPHLSLLTRLEILILDNTRIGDAGLAHLAHLTGLRELNLGNTRVRDLRILLEFSGWRKDNPAYVTSICFLGTPASKLTPLRRFQGEVRGFDQINQLLDVLRKEFPPYPIPFDEQGNAVEEDEGPEQLLSGFQVGELADGRLGFIDDPVEDLSQSARNNRQDLIEDLQQLRLKARAHDDNIHKSFVQDVEPVLQAIEQETADYRLIYRAARRLRRRSREERARGEEIGSERHFDPEVGEMLVDVVASYNAFALSVPRLRAFDEAGVDPAEVIEVDITEEASAIAQAMSERGETFVIDDVNQLRHELTRAVTTPADRRDWRVNLDSLLNLLISYATRAKSEIRKLNEGIHRLVGNEKIQYLSGAIITAGAGTLGVEAALATGAASGVPAIFASLLCYKFEKKIFKILDSHPSMGSLKTLIALNNAGLRKILSALQKDHPEYPSDKY